MKLKNILVCPKLGITFSLLQFRFYYDENCRKLSMLQNLSQIAQHELTTPYLKINNKRNPQQTQISQKKLFSLLH